MTASGSRNQQSPIVDVGILTIKEEEFDAALSVFDVEQSTYIGPQSARHYNLRTTSAGGEDSYRVAIVRLVEQGNGEAQSAARDMIAELQPSLLLVVGIAGGVPSHDLTLGDVLLSLRIVDYTLHARKQGEEPTYGIAGGPIEQQLERGVVNLPARRAELKNWSEKLPPHPIVDLANMKTYGPAPWQKNIRESLEYHFAKNPHRTPKFLDGVLGSSDGLIKDVKVIVKWLETSRNLRAVDMESAGVYRAAQGQCAMIAIRGISDLVGLKRDEAWTHYACATAAHFARAYLSTRPIEPRLIRGIAPHP